MGTLIRDRTSEVPEVILQHILSFLPVTDAARASMLSKTWSQAWFTRPNLIFNQISFRKSKQAKRRFKLFVFQTLKRYLLHKIQHKHVISVQNMTISVDMLNDHQLALYFLWWIKMAKSIRVNNLHVSIKNFAILSSEIMQMIVSAEQLISICIKGRKSASNEPSVICGNVSTIKCTCLQSLILCHVKLDEKYFHNLLSCCPLIESLVLEGCTGLKRIWVQETCPCLKQFEISELKSEMDEVNINAPSLESFIYKVLTEGVLHDDSVLRIKLGAPNLKHLELSEANITNEYLDELLLTSPVLEDLTLKNCYKLERIYVSSLSLQRFSQLFCKNLLGVNLNAPSLVSYQCYGMGSIPSLTFCKDTIPMDGRIVIDVSNGNATSLLLKLRDFVSKVKNTWITIAIMYHEDTNVDLNLEDLRAYPIPVGHQVKELSLNNLSFTSSSIFEVLVEGLLWACQPIEFIMSSKIDGDIDVVNTLVRKLLMDKGEDLSCCCKDDDQTMCRRHCFTDLRVESFDYNYSHPNSIGTFKFCQKL